MATKRDLRERRKARLRFQLRQKGGGRPRLSVFRSSKHIYAQVIDDSRHHTLAAAGSVEPALRQELHNNGATCTAAARVGQVIAERALARGIQRVVFDRGGNLYHGRVKALAEAARAAGLEF